MKCNNCGNTITEGAPICPMCGMPVDTTSQAKETQSTPAVEKEQPAEASQLTTAPVEKPAEVIQPTQPASEVTSPSNGMPPQQPAPKKDNKVFIIICAVLVVVIIVLLVLVLNNNGSKSDDKNNNKTTEKTSEKTTEKTTDSTTSSTTSSVVTQVGGSYTEYSGIQLYVPETFTTQIKNNLLVYTSNTKRQQLILEPTNLDYTDLTLDDFSKSFNGEEFQETSREENERNGVKYAIFRGSISGMNFSTGYASFAPGYIVIFMLATDYAKESAYLDTLMEIIKNSKSTSSFAKGENKDYKAQDFVKNITKFE